jgi:hypothetical protein
MYGIEFKNIMKNFSIKAGGIFEEYPFIETNEYGESLFSYVYSIGNTLRELVPAFHYFRFNEIKQFGFGHYEIAPTDYSQLNYEFFLDLGTIRLAYCTLAASIYIPSRNHETNAFNAKIDGRISYSRTIFAEGVWGFCAAISFNNIPLLICHGNLSIGYSMNDDKVLMWLPIKDQGIFAISLKLF